MLQCDAEFGIVLQCVVSLADFDGFARIVTPGFVAVCCSVLQCVEVCCSVLQCVAVCSSMLQYVAVCCSVLQCVAVCCSVLQCVAVCCSVPQRPREDAFDSPDLRKHIQKSDSQ